MSYLSYSRPCSCGKGHGPFLAKVGCAGLFGEYREVVTDFELGRGRYYRGSTSPLTRFLFDLAFGYVSGFRKRDIAYYLLTRNLPRKALAAVIKFEQKRTHD